MMKYYLLLLLMILYNARETKAQRPNIIFILVDDLGKEWISCYGASEIKTPNIDHLAESGIKFNRAYSMPQCTPSRVTLLTGQYPYEHGWINHYDVPRWGHRVRFDPELNPVFVKELKAAGYRTCAAGKWQINDFRVEPEAMVNAGFDEYCMWTGGEGGNEKVSDERYWDPYIHTKDGSKTYAGKFGPDIYSDFIIDFLSREDDRPFFAYYPMTLTHTPFVHTPLKPNATTDYEKHQAMVEYTDFIIGKIMTAIDQAGLRENTYIFFTTDNGTTPAIIGKRNEEYIRGGKTYLTENGINAPFIVRTPKDYPGISTDAILDFTDIYPTMLDLAGLNIKSDNISGRSFAPVLNQPSTTGGRKWISALGSHPAKLDSDGRMQNYHRFRDRIIADERYKVYIDTSLQINRIYDLQIDPAEINNLISDTRQKRRIQYFERILDKMPIRDHQSHYTKSDTSYFDAPVNLLNMKSAKVHKQNKNMSPKPTESEFLRQKSN